MFDWAAGSAAVLLSERQGAIALTSFREDAASASWSQSASRTFETNASPERMVHVLHSHDGASLLLSHPSTSGRTQLSMLDSESLEVGAWYLDQIATNFVPWPTTDLHVDCRALPTGTVRNIDFHVDKAEYL